MDAKRFGLLALAVVAVVGLVACQESEPAPVAPENDFEALVGEVRGNGYGIGGVKVDSVCNACNGDFEDNTIGAGSTMTVWINNPTGDWCGSYYYTISDRSDVFVGSASLGGYDHACGSFRGYDIVAPGSSSYGTSDSVTLQVWCNNSTSIGSDSFRLLDNGNCEK